MADFTAGTKLLAVERELRFRHRVYGERVKAGRMSPAKMMFEIGVMESIADDYRREAEKERLI
jgi:hypothetical protein